MPKAWSKKDERQYEHVESSEKKRGRSTKRAKEIAARTVNKERSKEGRTKSKSSKSKSKSKGSSKSKSSSKSRSRKKK
ncbi:MAG TPA: addiction module toxin RelE [Thermoanaerobaculia bacterium]|jgi:hypothetical protein|nr:addiction module toxin RelE [Thermoanaerobaculia bacterium]